MADFVGPFLQKRKIKLYEFEWYITIKESFQHCVLGMIHSYADTCLAKYIWFCLFVISKDFSLISLC